MIKKLGADLKLSGRTIQFTPIKYLVPIEKQYPELRRQFELARTDSQQRKNDPLRTVFSQWCRIVNEVRTLIEEDLTSGENIWFIYSYPR